ncbi:hypothetical protein BJX64DRAFT_289857 [Aspergillus heterothallicus]
MLSTMRVLREARGYPNYETQLHSNEIIVRKPPALPVASNADTTTPNSSCPTKEPPAQQPEEIIDRFRPFSRLPRARQIAQLNAQSVFKRSTWHCYAGKIIAGGRNTAGYTEFAVQDEEECITIVRFAKTKAFSSLFPHVSRILRVGHLVLIRNAKRHREYRDGPEENARDVIIVQTPRDVKFLQFDHNFLASLIEALSKYSTNDLDTRCCFGCDKQKRPEDISACRYCGAFWFCNAPDNEPNPCLEHANAHREHAQMCLVLSDPDMSRISNRHCTELSYFEYPMIWASHHHIEQLYPEQLERALDTGIIEISG